MQDLLISFSNNVLKITAATKEGFHNITKEVASNQTPFADLRQTILELTADVKGLKLQNLNLIFLAEPKDVHLSFVTIAKTDEVNGDKIVTEIKSKLEVESLEDYYFSYQKIAPFVYQVIATKKDYLDNYLELASSLGMSLKAVVPWVLLLPKFLASNDPCVFLFQEDERQVLALAELNGIYFSQSYDGTKSLEELQDLVKQLSVYKRTDPITKVYTLTDDNFNLSDDFKVEPLLKLSEESKQYEGYELHLLVEEVLGNNPDYLLTQVNTLNLLPVPVMQEKSKLPVYAGATVAALLLVVAGFGVYKYSQNEATSNEQLATGNETNVLSEQNVQEEPVEEVIELKKEDLVIRVENGAGIPGIAGEAQTYLEEKDWTVLEVDNADNSDYENTILRFKTSKVAFKDLLSEDMPEDYTVVIEEGLDEELDYDVVVIVGAN